MDVRLNLSVKYKVHSLRHTHRVSVSAKSGLVIMCVSPCFTMTCVVPSSSGCLSVATYVQFTDPPGNGATSDGSKPVPSRLFFTLISMRLFILSMSRVIFIGAEMATFKREKKKKKLWQFLVTCGIVVLLLLLFN